jgi:DNA polymerase I-like protein with 3'-5' exonuclease and polymerase domains/uracil-DNA glycosylase
VSEKRPLFLPIAIEEIEREACTGCKLKDLKSNCRFQPLVIYNKEGAPFPEAETNRLELLVVADTPSFDDNKSTRFWGSPSGASLLRKIKGLGVESFAVIPAVRCYPGGDIDHNVITKKYKGSPKFTKETPLDRATKAVENCKEYVRTTLRTYNPKFVLAMGPLAAAALDLSGSIPQLRTQPIRPKPGLRSANPDEGIIVTYDRFEAATNDWAFREIQRDFQKIGNAKSCGFANPRGNDKTVTIKVMNTVSRVRKFVDWMLTTEFDPQEVMCIDFETENMDLSTETNRLLNVGITRTCDEDVAYVVPLAHPETPFTPDELVEVYALMKRLFRSEGASFYGWCGHNTQYEVTMVKLFFDEWLGEGGNVKTLDTMVMAYILDEDRSESINRPYSLETLASEMLDFRWYGQSAMKSKRDRLSSEPISDVNTYVGYDAIVTARLLNELLERMQEEGSASDLLRLATKLYGPAIHYTVDLKLTGQQIDVDVLRMLRAPNSSIVHRLGEIEQEFADAPEVAQALAIINQKAHGGKGMAPVFKTNTNKTFSLTSHEHRVALFWDVLELDGANESVDKKFQERHKGHRLVDLFGEYQQLSKLDSSYLKPLADWLQSPNSRDGRVRPNFNLVNTRTGRLSASEPNTQQQPRSDSTAKKQIKGMFKASEGKILVQLDFSQAEVRWLGILSGDEALAEKYKMADELSIALLKDPNNEELKKRVKIDGDLHMSTAITMYKLNKEIVVTDEKEAKKYRQRAKACVHPETLIGLNGELRHVYLGMKSAAGADPADGQIHRLHGVSVWNGAGHDIPALAVHPLIQKRGVHVVTRRGALTCSYDHMFKLADGRLVDAQDLKPGDVPVDTQVPVVTDKPYPAIRHRLFNGTPPVVIELNDDVAYFAGMYTGDGCRSRHSASIAHGALEKVDTHGVPYKEWQAIIMDAASRIGLEPREGNRAVYLGHRHTQRYLEAIGLLTPTKKSLRIPDWITKSGKTAICQFLAGLIDTDGTVDKKTGMVSFATKDVVLVGQVAAAARSCGLRIAVEPCWNKTYEKYYYRMRIMANDAFSVLKPFIRHPGKSARLRPMEVKQQAQNQVLLVQEAGDISCLDISVGAEDHLYMTNGLLTHNTCFGLIYGKAAKSLAKDLGIDEEEADEAVELWLSQFPKAAAWLTSQEDYVVKHGYVKSAFGRWRRLPEAQAANRSVVNRAKRQSRNTPIQSAASDGCIYAACRLRDALRASSDPALRQIRLINTVHDSLIAEAPFDETAIRSYCKLAKSIFTDRNLLMKDFGVDIIVPLAVDFDIGLNWGNMTDYDFTEKALKRALHDAEALRQQPPGTLLSDLKGKGLLFDEQQKKEEK